MEAMAKGFAKCIKNYIQLIAKMVEFFVISKHLFNFCLFFAIIGCDT